MLVEKLGVGSLRVYLMDYLSLMNDGILKEGMKIEKDVKKAMPLYLVTDRRWLKESLIQTVEKAIQGGVTCVQLREKHLDQKYFVESARQLLSLCHQHHIPLIINDDVDVMITVQADGVHVGQNDMDAKR